MTTWTLLDTNVLIDVLGDGPDVESSRNAIVECLENGGVVISAIVWAELAQPFLDEGQLASRIAWMRPKREAFPFAAAFPAGRAHQLYRQRGGTRERTLPDFLIGAHALVAGHRLLTRDASRYRTYFPTLDIVVPDTHS